MWVTKKEFQELEKRVAVLEKNASEPLTVDAIAESISKGVREASRQCNCLDKEKTQLDVNERAFLIASEQLREVKY